MRAALLALCISAALLTYAVAAWADDPQPPEKQAEIDAATVSTAPLTNPPDTAVLQPAGFDAGPATDVMQVKSDLVTDRQTEQAILGLPQAPAGLQVMLGEVTAASVLDQQTSTAATAMAQAYADPTYQPYIDNLFVVDQWQGVQVSGATAGARLMAHDAYKNPDGTWEHDISRQWQVQLSLESGHWKLVSHKEVDPANAPVDQLGQDLPASP
jgi:hypothetical protein